MNDKLIISDLKKMNHTMDNNYIKKQEENRLNFAKIITKKSKKKSKLRIKYNKISYSLNSVKLSGKYLTKYNNLLYNKDNYNILFQDLIDSGYYLYDFKIKQKLSKCGLNRVKQLYGTCWLDSLINGFIFSDKIKSRLLELIDHYIKINKIKDIKKYINNINKKKTKLNINVDKNQNKIFIYFINIIYDVLCNEGMRNKKISEHDNFVLTNFAINIRNFSMKKKVKNILKSDYIAYNSYYAIENILYTFNHFIDKKPQVLYYDSKYYSIENSNTLNQNQNLIYRTLV